MKGISLPFNIIVILILCLIVLAALAGFFIFYMNPNMNTIGDYDAWVRGCGIAKNRGCSADEFDTGAVIISSYDPDGDGNNNDLLSACRNFYSNQTMDKDACKKYCCGY